MNVAAEDAAEEHVRAVLGATLSHIEGGGKKLPGATEDQIWSVSSRQWYLRALHPWGCDRRDGLPPEDSYAASHSRNNSREVADATMPVEAVGGPSECGGPQEASPRAHCPRS